MAVPLTSAMQTQIANLYISILGRNPDPTGFGYWCDAYANANGTQTALDSIASGFGKSPEFTGTYSGQTPAQAVNIMYNNILGRNADSAGATYWTGVANAYITAGKSVSDAYALTANAIITAAAANTGTADATLIAGKQTAAVTAGTSAPVVTYTLGTGTDAINVTTANAVVNGTMSNSAGTDNGTFNSNDSITSSAANTTLNVRVTSLGANQTVTPLLTNVSTLSVSNVATANTATIDLASSTGTTTVQFKDTIVNTSSVVLNASTTAAIALNNADSATHNVNLGSASGRTGTADAFSLSVLNGSGASAATSGLNLITAAGANDTSFEVANITVGGAANFVSFGAALAGLTRINVSGAGTNTTGYALTLNEPGANFNAMRTINASGLTAGGLNVTVTGAATLAYTGSAGNDRLAMTGGIANVVAADTFTFGAGTADTLALGTDTTTAGYTAAQLGYINAISDLEVIEFTAANTGAIDATLFTVATGIKFSTAATTATTTAVTGNTANSFTFSASHDVNLATAAAGSNMSGGSGAGGAGTAGASNVAAVSFTGGAVGSVATLKLAGGVALDMDGGAGGAGGNASGASATGGVGGAGSGGAVAIDFGANITKLVIDSSGTSANSITGGDGGAGGAGGTGGVGGAGGAGGSGAAAINNGTQVQNVQITGTQDLTIIGGASGAGGAGGAAGSGASGANGAAGGNAPQGFTGAVNIDSSTFTGKLTINLSTSGDVLTMGTGGGTVRGMGGADSITFNATGVDKLNLTVAADSQWNTTGITLSNFTSGQDKFIVGTLPTLVKSGTGYATTGTGVVVTDVGTAITNGGGFGGANNVAVVTITGGSDAGTYLVIDSNGSNTYSNADAVVKIVGSSTFTTGDFSLT